MNIFATDPDPSISARALDDSRLVKMTLETAQILSTAYGGPYRPTHRNHPCVLWAANDLRNAKWLADHGKALAAEYKRRFGRVHGSQPVLYWASIEIPSDLPRPVSFHNSAANRALNLDFTHISDTHEAYRAYLNARWALAANTQRPPRWTLTQPPTWAALS